MRSGWWNIYKSLEWIRVVEIREHVILIEWILTHPSHP